MNRTIKVGESQLREIIYESVISFLNEWAEPGEGRFYPGKYIYYPSDGKLVGDMGYEINDIGGLVEDNPENVVNGIMEYFEDDYVDWEDERDPEAPAVMYVTDGNGNAIGNTYYISSLDAEYAPQIQAALGAGAKVVPVSPANIMNENRIRRIVRKSIKKIMNEEGIHIKDENKGKFNATKERTGKSTEELTHSKNPVTRKRAIFAQNAKKWKK